MKKTTQPTFSISSDTVTSGGKPSTLVAKTPSFLDLYWQSYSRFLHDDDSGIADLQLACQSLLAAVIADEPHAAYASDSIPERILTNQLLSAADTEFLTRLESISTDSRHYHQAQVTLFLLRYTGRYTKIYSDPWERFDEVNRGLRHLQQAGEACDDMMRSFASQVIKGWPDAVTTESLISDTYRILLKELIGRDPLVDFMRDNYPSAAKGLQTRNLYSFRLFSDIEMLRVILKIIPSQQKKSRKFLQKYHLYLNDNVYKTNCVRTGSDRYIIHLSEDIFSQADKSSVYIMDPITHAEVCRLEKKPSGYYFKGYGQTLRIEAAGQAAGTAWTFESLGGDITLDANFDSESSVFLTADVAYFRFVGKHIKAAQSLLLESHGRIELSRDSVVTAGSNLTIRAVTLHSFLAPSV